MTVDFAIGNTALDQELAGLCSDDAFNVPAPATAALSLHGLGALQLRRRV